MLELLVKHPVMTLFAPVGVIVAVVLLGIWPLRERNTRSAVRGEAVAHGAACLILFAALYFLVPHFKKLYLDYGVDLPDSTITLLRSSDTVVAYWYLFLLLAAGIVVAETQIFFRLHRQERTRHFAKLWTAAITGLIVLLLLLGICGLAVPWDTTDLS